MGGHFIAMKTARRVCAVSYVPPLAAGLVSLEQARRHFCVGFAMAGIRNFGALGSPDKVADSADRAADRWAALVLTGYMSAIAAVITVAVALLPI